MCLSRLMLFLDLTRHREDGSQLARGVPFPEEFIHDATWGALTLGPDEDATRLLLTSGR